jgi:hypothetical protein
MRASVIASLAVGIAAMELAHADCSSTDLGVVAFYPVLWEVQNAYAQCSLRGPSRSSFLTTARVWSGSVP